MPEYHVWLRRIVGTSLMKAFLYQNKRFGHGSAWISRGGRRGRYQVQRQEGHGADRFRRARDGGGDVHDEPGKAAPVKLSMAHVKSGKACAIVANSGNANACTSDGPECSRPGDGLRGRAPARLRGKPRPGLLDGPHRRESADCQGGSGHQAVAGRPLAHGGASAAAQAIMTTDTFRRKSPCNSKRAERRYASAASPRARG